MVLEQHSMGESEIWKDDIYRGCTPLLPPQIAHQYSFANKPSQSIRRVKSL